MIFNSSSSRFTPRYLGQIFEWKITALTWAIMTCKQTAALEKLEGQARWYSKMNKGSSFGKFLCLFLLVSSRLSKTTLSWKRSREEKVCSSLLRFAVSLWLAVWGRREKNHFLYLANLQKLVVSSLIFVFCVVYNSVLFSKRVTWSRWVSPAAAVCSRARSHPGGSVLPPAESSQGLPREVEAGTGVFLHLKSFLLNTETWWWMGCKRCA